MIKPTLRDLGGPTKKPLFGMNIQGAEGERLGEGGSHPVQAANTATLIHTETKAPAA